MENRWRNLVIIIVAVTIIFLAYFIIFQQKSTQFEDGYKEMKQIFSKRGISITPAKIGNLPDANLLISDLKEYKQNLSQYANNEKIALANLADVYIIKIEILGDSSNVLTDIYSIVDSIAYTDVEEICGKIENLRASDSELNPILARFDYFQSFIEEFESSYSNEAKIANMSEIKANMNDKKSSLEQVSSDATNAIETMEEICE